ncbi:hypothetical protein F4776DRAFT_302323 [Hypoxylon sp. NC0597]|nr:hypothetical protein F4776DRAFT_302323 [Hypoxylon sp. NC0597]
MPQFWDLPQALRLAALFAATASASFIRPSALLERADGTCAQNFSKCPQSGLPNNFCCESGSTCITLAANTTVLCCPSNSNCDKIGTITCDLSLQDASTNPTAEIKTTVLDGILETCGRQCCPFGYHCDGVNCVKDADQSKRPSTKPTSSKPSSTVAPTSVSTSKPSTTVAVSGIGTVTPSTTPSTTPPTAPSTETPITSTASTANTVKIVGGVIGGVVGIALIILAVVLLRFRRKKAINKEQLQRYDSTSSFGNIISAPVPHANYPSQRLDFLAKSSQASTASPSLAMSSPTAVASPPRQHQQEMYEYGGPSGFMPPNSPYHPHARRPDSEMSDVPRSHHASAEITGLRSLTHWKQSANGHGKANPNDKGKGKAKAKNLRDSSPAPAPLVTVTPAEDDYMPQGRTLRRPSEGESINVFADPLMVGGRPESAATTWSNIQQRADIANRNTNANTGGRLGESRLRNQ